MAKAPTKRAPVRNKPQARGPINQSKAAGAPAPASAAATAPMDASSQLQSTSFYDPAPVTQTEAELGPQQQTLRVGFKQSFVEATRHGSMPLEHGGTVDRDVAESLASEAITDPTDLAAEIARIRQFRKPIGAYSQKLALPKRSGYHRHWFNDTAGRVQEAEANGWSFIQDKDGKNICRCVGTGRDKGAMYAYAMELPEVFWLEDMAARNAAASEKVEALKASPFRSQPGQAQRSDQGKFYSPTEVDGGQAPPPLQVIKG